MIVNEIGLRIETSDLYSHVFFVRRARTKEATENLLHQTCRDSRLLIRDDGFTYSFEEMVA